MKTKTLLAGGAVAGPLFTIVALLQVVTRQGFDLSKQQLSLLSNGDLGWIQVTNFLITGILFGACAIGMTRVLDAGPASTWAPRLIAVFGLGLIAAAAFRADAAFGFPPGTPEGPPAAISWHGGVHLAAASLGFLALIIACFAFGRRFGKSGRGMWAAWSYATGAVFLIATVANGAMAGQAAANVAFTVTALLSFLWASAVAATLSGDVAAESRPSTAARPTF